jgi:hypothetical protein
MMCPFTLFGKYKYVVVTLYFRIIFHLYEDITLSLSS